MTFDELRACWPTGGRVGSVKEARLKFDKLSADEQAGCVKGARLAASSASWAMGYEPMLTRWINGELWKPFIEAEYEEGALICSDREWAVLQAHYRKHPQQAVVCRHDPECRTDLDHALKLIPVLMKGGV
jgi:hypothetical protein